MRDGTNKTAGTAQPKPKLLIAGAGAAGLEALIGLRDLAEDRLGIELLSPERQFIYRPLAIGEPFGLGAARRYELAQIASDHRATLTAGTLESVDTSSRSVQTRDGRRIEYDILLVALGAAIGRSLPGAITLLGPGYTSHFGTLLRELDEGSVRRVIFASPAGIAWQLPMYEVALMTAARLVEREVEAALSIVTPESEPLGLFGHEASRAAMQLLEARGISVTTGCYPTRFEKGVLTLVPAESGPLNAERLVSLPELTGPRIEGLPQDVNGFLPVDLHGRVSGEQDVYAAGDATDFPIKQGGLATQQADAAAESIAARLGAPVTPEPFRPVLRGLLLTGGAPRYMRAEIAGGRGEEEVSEHALWWPPSKIAGRYLSPYLGTHHRKLSPDGGVPVEVDLTSQLPHLRRRGIITPLSGGSSVLRLPEDDPAV